MVNPAAGILRIRLRKKAAVIREKNFGVGK